ncbi:MAG: tetratricopeptide repeat protein [Terriglobia bacterium]
MGESMIALKRVGPSSAVGAQAAFVMVLLMVLFAGVSVCAAAGAQDSHPPLTEPQVLGLLNGGVANERLEAVVKNRGVAFRPTPADLDALRRAGASQDLIDAIRSAAPVPEMQARASEFKPAETARPYGSRARHASNWSASSGGGPAAADRDLSRGNTLFQQANWGAAVRSYESALLRDPNDVTVRTNLAMALSREGWLQEAVRQFKIVLRTAPALGEAHNGLGIAYRKEKNLPAAVHEFRAALRYNPRDARAHNNLAATLQEEGRLNDAIAEYRKSLRLDPDCCDARYNLGAALELEGDSQDAVTAFRAVVKADPRSARGHFALASALESNREYTAALEQYRIAARLAPGDRAIHRGYTALLAHLNSTGSPCPN